MASRYQTLMARRAKFNRESYNPFVYRKGKRITDPKELRNFKIAEIQRINKRLGARTPTRKTIRTISGIELTEAKKQIASSGVSANLGKASLSAKELQADLKGSVYKAKGDSLLLYNIGKDKAIRVKGKDITYDASKGLKGIKITKRNLLDSYKDLY